jgi:hypothetical protein
MKYIKTYEKIIEDIDYVPQRGDFVICEETVNNRDEELKDFLAHTIGEYMFPARSENPRLHSVKYDDIPYWEKSKYNFTKKGKFYMRNFYRREIKYISKKKADLEEILALKKYNL